MGTRKPYVKPEIRRIRADSEIFKTRDGLVHWRGETFELLDRDPDEMVEHLRGEVAKKLADLETDNPERALERAAETLARALIRVRAVLAAQRASPPQEEGNP